MHLLPSVLMAMGLSLPGAATIWRRHRRSEERLAQLKGFYERVLATISSGVFVADARDRVFYANAALRERFGILENEVGEESIDGHPLLPKLAPFRAAYRQAKETGSAIEFVDLVVTRLDGVERHHSGWMIPLNGDDGAFDGAICTTDDTTDRRLAEEELRTNRDMLNEILMITTDWVWECDTRARYTYASGRVRDVLGYEPWEVIGKTACDLVPPAEAQRTRDLLLPLLSEPRPFANIDLVGRHREGRDVLLEVSGVPMFDDAGKVLGYRGVVRDVTERERNKRERQRLATAIEHAGDAVIITNRQGVIEYVNPAFESVTGYSKAEVIGANPRILKSGRQAESFYAEFWNDLLAGRTWKGHFVNARRDASLYDADVTVSPIFDGEGRIDGFVAVQRDVSEKLELMQQLRNAMEMERFGRLVSGVAHEVRNPLNAIQAAAAALELDFGDDPEARALFEIVHAQVGRLSQLMRDLLIIGKPMHANWLARRRIGELATDALQLWRASYPEMPVERVRLTVAANDEVMVDGGRFHQVIVNLLDNAAQHSLDDTEIVLAVEPADDGRACRVSVRDYGPGIDPKHMARVFEPFFSTRRGGTGLGLSLVKSITEQHGGRVTLRNSVPAPGCIVEVLLPVAPPLEELEYVAEAAHR